MINASTIPASGLRQSIIHRDESVPLLEASIGEVLISSADRFGDRLALVDGQVDPAARRRWSYAMLAHDAKRVASALLRHFEPGQRVAIWSANSPEWALVEFGASLAGLVLVTVNPAYRAQELQFVLRQSQVRGIFVQDSHQGRDLTAVLQESRAELTDLEVVIPMSTWESFIDSGTVGALPAVEPSAPAQIQYTSGTTGFPKGACLTHRGLSNNARIYAQAIARSGQDVWINAMPMFHTAGCGLATLGALHSGGTHVLAPAFEAAHMLDLFEQEKGTMMLCVPTMLFRILEEQERNPRDLSSWRLVTLGGAPVPQELVRKAKLLTGAQVAIGFGQTEASPYLTHTAPDDQHPLWFETVGPPLPQTDLKIIDTTTGEIVPVGVSGEICARGYGLMTGYYNNPEATATAIDNEGWLHTGDIGSMDERGYCRVLGRLRDMIIRGGENVYPREVEDLLFTHPAIADVAVIGLPDPDWGETVAACVILREGTNVSPSELENFCRAQLAGFKVPRNWRFLDKFPQTASGKIQKYALRDQLLSSLTGPDER